VPVTGRDRISIFQFECKYFCPGTTKRVKVMNKGENTMSHGWVQAGLGVRRQLDAIGSFLP